MPILTPLLFRPFYLLPKPITLGILVACGFVSSANAVPILPAFVFDELWSTGESDDQTDDDPFANLDEELPSVPAIDERAVAQKLARLKAQHNTSDTPVFATFNQLDNKVSSTPLARLGSTTNPIGLTKDLLPEPTQPSTTQGLDPNQYLPAYQTSELPPTVLPSVEVVKKPPSLLKQTYRKVFKDGIPALERLSANIYVAKLTETQDNPPKKSQTPPTNDPADELGLFDDELWQFENEKLAELTNQTQNLQLTKADLGVEPFRNIANALANINENSVADFGTSIPRLTETIHNASRAVGFYDTKFHLKQEKDGKLAVVITQVGDPVKVASSVVDIRGAGATTQAFTKLKNTATPAIDTPFHHGDYETTKSAITQASSEHGFFDGKWLNHSADVLLPDNTADISLVYDTGEQYAFDEVIFFTIDPETGQLTQDPNKLPVNLSLLKKLVNFKSSDPFDRKKVIKLSNELLATRYFNTANVEVVLPEQVPANVDFVQETASESPPNAPDEGVIVDGLPDEGLPILQPAATTVTDENGQLLATISPIDFAPSQAIIEKVNLVKNKADRLLASPNDRILDESDKKSTTILGQISDVIQLIAQKILPDESKDIKPILADGETLPTLQNRKTGNQVFLDKKIPLYVFVSAEKPKDMQLGVGYGTNSGIRFTTRYENHLMNKKGFQSGVEIGLGKNSQTANLYASRPMNHPLNDKSTANLKFSQQNSTLSGFDLTTKTAEVGLSRTRIQENSWHRTYSLRYRLDALDTNAPTSVWGELPVQFLASGTHQEAFLAGFAMNKSTQLNSNLVAPTGYRQSYSLELGAKGVGNDSHLAILRAGINGVYSFGNNQWGENRKHQLIGRADFGYLWASDFTQVPYRLRFFAGGDQSVRGYDSESLSPVSSGGYLTGGQILATVGTEYSYEFMDSIRAAAFADMGNAYDKQLTTEGKLGVGLGIRYASSIGTVKLDIATNLNDKDQKRNIHLHFLAGLPF